MPVNCPAHGKGLGNAEGDEILTITGACGCSTSYGSGTTETSRCSKDGVSQIIFSEPVGSSRTHCFALLACGCQGDLWVFGTLSLFRRKEAVQ